MTVIRQLMQGSGYVLGEGAVIERLRRESGFDLDPFVLHAGFCYDQAKQKAMAAVFRQYLDIAETFDLPLMLSAPTWRAGKDRVSSAGLEERDVNGDNVRFVRAIAGQYGNRVRDVYVSGLLSCRGDSYNPGEALTRDKARSYHAWQAEKLAAAGVDFLMAATLPAFSEARGIAEAMADTKIPYAVSFVLRPEGTLLDGTPLAQAVAVIDDETDPAPMAFMINCTHPTIADAALKASCNASEELWKRLLGLQANTAALSPEELDNSACLVSDDPEPFARSVMKVARRYNLRLLGGCCGSDHRHIRAIARLMTGDGYLQMDSKPEENPESKGGRNL